MGYDDNLTILCIDDDESQIETFKLLLENSERTFPSVKKWRVNSCVIAGMDHYWNSGDLFNLFRTCIKPKMVEYKPDVILVDLALKRELTITDFEPAGDPKNVHGMKLIPFLINDPDFIGPVFAWSMWGQVGDSIRVTRLTEKILQDYGGTGVIWKHEFADKNLRYAAFERIQEEVRKRIFFPSSFERLNMFLGNHPDEQFLKKKLQSIAKSAASVLITGPSGCGKEVLAKAIHQLSDRKLHPFKAIQCSANAETLLEDDLFGHEKGAFTGANSLRRGVFERADKGTIFFDEIATMPLGTQVKLLRVLQEREFERLGGEQTISVNVRILAATNADIKKEVKEEKFREDLYSRLNVIPLKLPPLSERKELIRPLANYFLNKHKDKDESPLFQESTLRALEQWDWPTNIRELENAIQYALAMRTGKTITIADLPKEIKGSILTKPRVKGGIPAEKHPSKTIKPSDPSKEIESINIDEEAIFKIFLANLFITGKRDYLYAMEIKPNIKKAIGEQWSNIYQLLNNYDQNINSIVERFLERICREVQDKDLIIRGKPGGTIYLGRGKRGEATGGSNGKGKLRQYLTHTIQNYAVGKNQLK